MMSWQKPTFEKHKEKILDEYEKCLREWTKETTKVIYPWRKASYFLRQKGTKYDGVMKDKKVEEVIAEIEKAKAIIDKAMTKIATKDFDELLIKPAKKMAEEYRESFNKILDDPYKMTEFKLPEYFTEEDKKLWKDIQGKLKGTGGKLGAINDMILKAYEDKEFVESVNDLKNVEIDQKLKEYVRERVYNEELKKDIDKLKKNIKLNYAGKRLQELDLDGKRDVLNGLQKDVIDYFDELKYLVSKKGYDTLEKRRGELEERLKEYITPFRNWIIDVITFFTFGKFKYRLLDTVNANINSQT